MTILSRLISLLLLVFVSAEAAPQQVGSYVHAEFAPPESVATGIAVIRGKVSTQFGSFSFVGLKIKADIHSVSVASALPGYGKGGYGNGEYGGAQTLFALKDNSHAEAVLSGGFMTTFYPPVPLGFLKHSGSELNRPASSELLNGIVTSEGNRLEIRRFNNPADCLAECLQAGPLLVSDKRVSLPEHYADSGIEGDYRRALVATLPDGYFVLAIASGAKLRALATFLAAPVERGGMGCQDALNLSGSTSAGMLWENNSEGDTKTPIASALAVR
jgi:hypothetical protein